MTRSMTGFATRTGTSGGWSWTWDLRAVNGRGYDLRLRLPDWIEGLEPAVRAAMKDAVQRGNVTLSLKVSLDEGAEAPVLNATALSHAIALVARVEAAAAEGDLSLAPTSAADLLSLRGVVDTRGADADPGALREALLADLPALMAEFDAMRAAEGAALAEILTGQIDRIAALTDEAAALEPERAARAKSALADGVARVLEATQADPARLEQELAILAVKSDVTEELDRLRAHVNAARELVAASGPKGRKLDFLTQEFNREANTLCSKAGFAALTRVGLDLKTVIDQMREQVQNVE